MINSLLSHSSKQVGGNAQLPERICSPFNMRFSIRQRNLEMTWKQCVKLCFLNLENAFCVSVNLAVMDVLQEDAASPENHVPAE